MCPALRLVQRKEEEALTAMCWKTILQSLPLSLRGLQDWKATIVLGTWPWADGGRSQLVPRRPYSSCQRLLLLLKLTHLSHFPGVILSWDLWPFQIEASLQNNLTLKHKCHLSEALDFPPDLFGFTSQPPGFIQFCFAADVISIFSLILSLIPTSPSPNPTHTASSSYHGDHTSIPLPLRQVLPLSWVGRKKECGPTGSGLWKFLWRS